MTALRLAQLGHRVCLIERCAFPRPHVGESLTPGVWPIVDVLGLRESFVSTGVLESPDTLVRWAEARTERLSSKQRGPGLLIDRPEFDMFLLRTAAGADVRIFQPGQARAASRDDSGWRIDVAVPGASQVVRAGILVDATGRHGLLSGRRERVSPPTLALCGYLHGRQCPNAILVEALDDAWCWGAPLPGGLFSAMVFVDPGMLRPLRRETLETLWRSRLAGTQMFSEVSEAPLVHPVVARDATAYYAVEPIGPQFVRVGEANFSLDPLSSTGVEKAMQTGITAAIAIHTMLVRPEHEDVCVRFYRSRQMETVSAHAVWSARFYREARQYGEFPFWRARSNASGRQSEEQRVANVPAHPVNSTTRVRVSDKTRLVEEPCIVGDEIRTHLAVSHPRLDRPVAFVDDVAVGSLLQKVSLNPDVGGLLSLWSGQVSPRRVERLVAWMLNNEILEPLPQENGRPPSAPLSW